MTELVRPATLEAALVAMESRHAVAIAGCTDLMVIDHAQARKYAKVVDLTRIEELRGIRESADELWIGAGTTFAELRDARVVRERFPAIAAMSATIGAQQIQNRATVGGNIANASPAGDSLPVWLALGAEIELAGTSGRRRLPYEAMHLAYRSTALQPSELIVGLRVPFGVAQDAQRYWKVGTRAAQAISKVVLAMRASLRDGALHDVRLAAGSVAPIPLRLTATEQVVEGRVIDGELAARAGLTAANEVAPIDDVRSTADYRRFVIARTVRRMLLRCNEGAV